MYIINSVYTVTATSQPEVYIVRCNITTPIGDTFDCEYASLPTDSNGIGPAIRQWLEDNRGDYEVLPYIQPPPLPTIVRAEDFWSRLTNQEAEDIDAEMGTKQVRIRNMFRTASMFRSDNDLWPVLLSSLTDLFGATRAGEILSPSL